MNPITKTSAAPGTPGTPATAGVDVLPRGVLMAIAALVLVTLVAVAAVRLSGTNIREPDAAVVTQRALLFDDGADGSVVVTDATTGDVAARIHGEQGFLRGTLRAMARQRRLNGEGKGPPLVLMAHSDGRLTLFDPVTQQRIALESFGPTNAAVFANLLPQVTLRPAPGAQHKL